MATLQIDVEALKKDHWTDEESDNVQLVAGFVQKLMNDHEFEHVLETYANAAYRQHNRNIPDGIAGLVDVVRDFAKKFPDYCYDVKQIVADGDRVVFHSHATIKASHRGNDRKGLNITDNWKIKDGQIVEHWDSIQPIDMLMRVYVLVNGGAIKNDNGVF